MLNCSFGRNQSRNHPMRNYANEIIRYSLDLKIQWWWWLRWWLMTDDARLLKVSFSRFHFRKMIDHMFSVHFLSSCCLNWQKASPHSRSCPIEFLRKFLMILSLENDLLAVATVTGNVRNSSSAVMTSEKVDDNAALSTISIFAMHLTDIAFSISVFMEAFKQTSHQH